MSPFVHIQYFEFAFQMQNYVYIIRTISLHYSTLIFFPLTTLIILNSVRELLKILVKSNRNENSLCPFKCLPNIKKKKNYEVIIHEV